MKRIILVCLLLTMGMCLFACSGGKASEGDNASLNDSGTNQSIAGDSALNGDDASSTNGADDDASNVGNSSASDDVGKDATDVDEGAGESAGKDVDGGAGKDASQQDDAGFLCTLYILNDNADGLVEQEKAIESSSAWHMWAALKRANPIIPITAGLNSYKVVEGVGYLDVKAEIYGMNVGGGVESLIIQAIANTYIENTDADKVAILVDGFAYESGHFYLDEPIGFSA